MPLTQREDSPGLRTTESPWARGDSKRHLASQNEHRDACRVENKAVIQGRLHQGSPAPGPQTSTGPRPVRNRAAQHEVSGWPASKPHRLHYRPPSVEKLSSTKPASGAKKVGDRWSTHLCDSRSPHMPTESGKGFTSSNLGRTPARVFKK